MRSRISPAALFVKVTARIRCGATPCSRIRRHTRAVSTRVFPEPAPASTSSGPSTCSVAASCAGLSPSRVDGSVIGDGKQYLERGSLTALEQLDAAVVQLDDPPGQREADSPSRGLRAHTGLEDLVANL